MEVSVAWKKLQLHMRVKYIYICVYICIYLCVCVCARIVCYTRIIVMKENRIDDNYFNAPPPISANLVRITMSLPCNQFNVAGDKMLWLVPNDFLFGWFHTSALHMVLTFGRKIVSLLGITYLLDLNAMPIAFQNEF